MISIRFSRLAVAALAATALAPGAPALPKSPNVPKVRFEDYRLPNGMRVLLSRDSTAPVVAVSLTYNVGSFVEPKGRTGFAHLFEHLMFQGSENVGKAEKGAVIADMGGMMNGSTGQDRTNYYEIVPANQLEAVLFMEADTMRSLDVSQANLDNQRAVVQEEKRRSYDNRPYGQFYRILMETVYQDGPYAHVPIGSMEDLNAADLEYVRSFFRTYYAPNNVVMAIVGDIDIARTKELVNRYFADIPRGPEPAFPTFDYPMGTAERRVEFRDPLAPLPRVAIAWRTPDGNHPDDPALQVLGDILAGGKSSPMYRDIVEQRQLATSVGANGGAGRGPGFFLVMLNFAKGQDIRAAERAVYEHIHRIQTDGTTQAEIDKVRAAARRFAISGRRSVLDKANELSANAVIYGDPNRINTEIEAIWKVTPADVQRVARKYLQDANRNVITFLPGADEKGDRPQ